MAKRKDEDAAEFEKGDIRFHFKTRAIICVIVLATIVGLIFILAYSDWKIGPINHDADDFPKPKIKSGDHR